MPVLSFIVVDQHLDGPVMKLDVLFDDYMLYSVKIMHVDAHEKHLNAGRFANYVKDLSSNEVKIRLDSGSRAAVGPNNHHYIEPLTSMIEWCSDQTKNTKILWNMAIDPVNVSAIDARFNFSDPELAIQFKLTWA